MPALNSNVTAFLTQVKNDLTVGPSLDNNLGVLFGPGRNFCSAQDIANVLRLLASATGNTGLLASEISAIMSGKNPATQQYVGQIGGNRNLIIDAFKKLIEYAGATFPIGKIMFATTALAGASTTVIAINTRGTKLRIDEFRQYVLYIGGLFVGNILSNTADGLVTIDRATTAPSGGEAVTVNHSYTNFGCAAEPKTGSGGQPGDNARLAFLITAAQAAVVAYTPTTITIGAPSGSAHVAGAAATFTVVFGGTAPTSNIVVPVVSSDVTKVTVSPATLTFTPGNYTTPQNVTATAVAVAAGTPVNVGPATGDVHFAGLNGAATIVTVSP